MKLAEALSIRADLQKRVAQLKERIKESAKVQEGDEPCDNVEELYKELDEALVQLEDLVYRINITNVQIVQGGDSLTRLIAKRDVLSMRVKALKEVVNYVAVNDTRYGRNELKYVRTIDIKALRKEVDTYAKLYRELDLKIQSLNWTVDLVDLQTHSTTHHQHRQEGRNQG